MITSKTIKKASFKITVLLFLLISITPHPADSSILDGLDSDLKKCKYIAKSEYQLFSNINTNFAAFKALGATSDGGCIKVQGSINKFLSAFFKIFVGIASVAAIINIAFAGIKTMLSESGVVAKNEWKKTVQASLEGLLIALTSWLLLSTINDRTLKNGLNMNTLSGVSAGISSGQDAAIDAIDDNLLIDTRNDDTSTGGTFNGSLNTETEAKLREFVQTSGLTYLNPSDTAEFFPNGATPEDWANLVKQIAIQESGLRSNDLYAENFGNRPPVGTPGRIPDSEYPKGSESGKLSIGLMSLSWDDPEVQAKGYTERDLQDPVKNLEVGVTILKNRIQQGGCISCGSDKGGASYWSVLRDSKRQQIIESLQNN